MTAVEAKEKIDCLFDELGEAGIEVWGWDSGEVVIHDKDSEVFVSPRNAYGYDAHGGKS